MSAPGTGTDSKGSHDKSPKAFPGIVQAAQAWRKDPRPEEMEFDALIADVSEKDKQIMSKTEREAFDDLIAASLVIKQHKEIYKNKTLKLAAFSVSAGGDGGYNSEIKNWLKNCIAQYDKRVRSNPVVNIYVTGVERTEPTYDSKNTKTSTAYIGSLSATLELVWEHNQKLLSSFSVEVVTSSEDKNKIDGVNCSKVAAETWKKIDQIEFK